jgi:hypothetical protein
MVSNEIDSFIDAKSENCAFTTKSKGISSFMLEFAQIFLVIMLMLCAIKIYLFCPREY